MNRHPEVSGVNRENEKRLCNSFIIADLRLTFHYICLSFFIMAQMQIGEAVKQFVNKSRLKDGLRVVQIEIVWEEIMGKTIAKYTDKIQVINNKLFITTTVAPLKNELLYQKEQIIKRINEAMGEKVITDVVIQ